MEPVLLRARGVSDSRAISTYLAAGGYEGWKKALGMAPEAAAFLSNLVAGISVTSPHTIHPTLDAALIQQTVWERSIQIPDSLRPYLEV